MSLHPHRPDPIPEETARITRAAFPDGNPYIRMRDELDVIYQDEQFLALFPSRGKPAAPPWRLALVTILQFAENLSDRQAADAVRARIDWKYALSLELTDAGFDHTVLSEVRGRLLQGDDDPGRCVAERIEIRLVVGARDEVLPEQRIGVGWVATSLIAYQSRAFPLRTIGVPFACTHRSGDRWTEYIADLFHR